jgi:hypothetical protein
MTTPVYRTATNPIVKGAPPIDYGSFPAPQQFDYLDVFIDPSFQDGTLILEVVAQPGGVGVKFTAAKVTISGGQPKIAIPQLQVIGSTIYNLLVSSPDTNFVAVKCTMAGYNRQAGVPDEIVDVTAPLIQGVEVSFGILNSYHTYVQASVDFGLNPSNSEAIWRLYGTGDVAGGGVRALISELRVKAGSNSPGFGQLVIQLPEQYPVIFSRYNQDQSDDFRTIGVQKYELTAEAVFSFDPIADSPPHATLVGFDPACACEELPIGSHGSQTFLTSDEIGFIVPAGITEITIQYTGGGGGGGGGAGGVNGVGQVPGAGGGGAAQFFTKVIDLTKLPVPIPPGGNIPVIIGTGGGAGIGGPNGGIGTDGGRGSDTIFGEGLGIGGSNIATGGGASGGGAGTNVHGLGGLSFKIKSGGNIQAPDSPISLDPIFQQAGGYGSDASFLTAQNGAEYDQEFLAGAFGIAGAGPDSGFGGGGGGAGPYGVGGNAGNGGAANTNGQIGQSAPVNSGAGGGGGGGAGSGGPLGSGGNGGVGGSGQLTVFW